MEEVTCQSERMWISAQKLIFLPKKVLTREHPYNIIYHCDSVSKMLSQSPDEAFEIYNVKVLKSGKSWPDICEILHRENTNETSRDRIHLRQVITEGT